MQEGHHMPLLDRCDPVEPHRKLETARLQEQQTRVLPWRRVVVIWFAPLLHSESNANLDKKVIARPKSRDKCGVAATAAAAAADRSRNETLGYNYMHQR